MASPEPSSQTSQQSEAEVPPGDGGRPDAHDMPSPSDDDESPPSDPDDASHDDSSPGDGRGGRGAWEVRRRMADVSTGAAGRGVDAARRAVTSGDVGGGGVT